MKSYSRSLSPGFLVTVSRVGSPTKNKTPHPSFTGACTIEFSMAIDALPIDLKFCSREFSGSAKTNALRRGIPLSKAKV